MNKCEFCNKEFSNPGGLGSHSPYCKLNPNRTQRKKSPNAHAKKGSIPWNKGLTKESDIRVEKYSIATKIGMSNRVVNPLNEIERIRKITEKAKINNGGYRQGGGRGKKGWYKNIWCDSSWELAWVIYNLDHNVKFSKNTKKFPYVFEGKIKNYIPDFLLSTGEYVEVKGYYSPMVIEKIKQFPHKLVMVDIEKMRPILNYVKEKYGKNFVEMYERIDV